MRFKTTTWILNRSSEMRWCLSLPFQPVCRPDCPGLDPETGLRLADHPELVTLSSATRVGPRSPGFRLPKTNGADARIRRRPAERRERVMAVPKRKKSRANTHARRSQWKAEVPTLVKTVENGKVTYSLPHRAKVVEDSRAPRSSSSTRAARSPTSSRPEPAERPVVRTRSARAPGHSRSPSCSARCGSSSTPSPAPARAHAPVVRVRERRHPHQRAPRVPRRLDPRAGRHGEALHATTPSSTRASWPSAAPASCRRPRSRRWPRHRARPVHPARSRRDADRRRDKAVDPRRHGRGDHRRGVPRRAAATSATDLVLRLVAPLLADPERFGAAMDPKTSLQEIAARRGAAAPSTSSPRAAPTTTSTSSPP